VDHLAASVGSWALPGALEGDLARSWQNQPGHHPMV
jgi:hypothetical protein